MSTTTVQERVRVIVLRAVDSYGPVGLDSVSRANIASYVVSGLLSAGLLRGDDDLPAGLRERCRRWIATAPLESPTGEVMREHDALLRALTGAGEPEARRMRGTVIGHCGEHTESDQCGSFHCQPVAEPAPSACSNCGCDFTIDPQHGGCACVPGRAPEPVEKIDHDKLDRDRSALEEAYRRRFAPREAMTTPCRHPGAVAVETVREAIDWFVDTTPPTVRAWRLRVTALFCPTPGCEKRIEVKHD